MAHTGEISRAQPDGMADRMAGVVTGVEPWRLFVVVAADLGEVEEWRADNHIHRQRVLTVARHDTGPDLFRLRGDQVGIVRLSTADVLLDGSPAAQQLGWHLFDLTRRGARLLPAGWHNRGPRFLRLVGWGMPVDGRGGAAVVACTVLDTYSADDRTASTLVDVARVGDPRAMAGVWQVLERDVILCGRDPAVERARARAYRAFSGTFSDFERFRLLVDTAERVEDVLDALAVYSSPPGRRT